MSDAPGDHEGQVLRATVVVTGWEPGSEEDISDTIERVAGTRIALEGATLPLVVLDRALPDDARQAVTRLTAAGATTSVEETWEARGVAGDQRARPICPVCGSNHTQPFGHAGPAARVNTRCTDCGHQWRIRGPASRGSA